MTFRQNDDMFPGSQSLSPEKTEINNLKKQMDVLINAVSEINNKVNALSTEVDTAELKADSASIVTETVAHSEINNAEIEAETVTSSQIQDASIEDAEIVNAEINNATVTTLGVTNATIEAADVDSLGVDNATIESENVESSSITNLEAENAVVENAEVNNLELKNGGTVRGSVYFPEDGDKIYGEYLDIEAGEVSAKSLLRDEPADTNMLVGYNEDGKLIPVDGSLDPSNLWKTEGDAITPKNNKETILPGATISNLVTDEATPSLKQVSYDEDGRLIPSELKLSTLPHNAISKKTDGLYAPQMLISEETGQAIESKDDGIYVQKLTAGSNVEITEAGVVNATDTTYTAGQNIAISEDGEISCDISTMNYRGTVATYGDLPSTGQIVGDVWNVSSTNVNYCWDGESWIAIGSSIDVSGLMNKDGSNAAIESVAVIGSNEVVVKTSNGLKSAPLPEADSTLSKTSENPVQNKIITNAIATEIITNVHSDDDEENEYVYLNFNTSHIVGTPYVGQTVRLFLAVDVIANYSHVIDYRQIGGRLVYNDKEIVCYRAGQKIHFPTHRINNQYKMIQTGVCLELVYDGIEYVVMGNPEVITYASNTVSYRIKADGYIRMNGTDTQIYNSNSTKNINLPVAYKEKYRAVSNLTAITWNSSRTISWAVNTEDLTTLKVSGGAESSSSNLQWMTFGY